MEKLLALLVAGLSIIAGLLQIPGIILLILGVVIVDVLNGDAHATTREFFEAIGRIIEVVFQGFNAVP
jgi:hypothetical protein